MDCGNCGKPLSEARRAALPQETWCRDCVEQSGDIDRIRGVMTWEHKTAPTLVLGHAADTIRKFDRRGFHAALPLSSPNNPRMQASAEKQRDFKDLHAIINEEPTIEKSYDNIPRARCHPDRPKVGTSRLCPECAAAWYAKRLAKP
jgi:hypothetical protein